MFWNHTDGKVLIKLEHSYVHKFLMFSFFFYLFKYLFTLKSILGGRESKLVSALLVYKDLLTFQNECTKYMWYNAGKFTII